ncbi:MAG TPA: flagellar biosynthetic protein FliR [Verrucomicrobiae bacterium]|nr:flagellar biosynthetic protein FliR [Verrucomicrobiae bacterium]
MFPADPVAWMLIFARISAMLAIFPIFSSSYFPVQIRVALGALLSFLVAATLPPHAVAGLTSSWWGMVSVLATEVGIGLLLGFVSRMVFYALDAAGNIIATEMGLMLAADFNPFSNARTETIGVILNYLAITLFLSTDLHHWAIIAMQRSYVLLPIGGAGLSAGLFVDVVKRTSWIFVLAAQLSAPLIATSFVITLVFSVLGRAVPQMNVFAEHFAFRTMAGLFVFGLTLNLSAQHIMNYLHRLPEDMLRVAQLLGGRA